MTWQDCVDEARYELTAALGEDRGDAAHHIGDAIEALRGALALIADGAPERNYSAAAVKEI